ncbi:MAG: fatty acyl-AMP ligase, partial [Ktedonobacteraceae bacterium]
MPVPPGSNQQAQRIQAIFDDAQAKMILTSSTMLAKLQRQLDHLATLETLHWLTTDQQPHEADATWQEIAMTDDDLALLQYTSGSTGSPKGAMLSHRNLLAHLELICQAFGAYADDVDAASSVGVSWLPMYHDMGLMHILVPLYVNAATIFLSPTAFIEKPWRWLQAISRYKAAVSGGPNFAYELCLEKVTPEQRQTLDLSSWQIAFCGAEPIHAETLQRFANTFATSGFRQSALYPCYGLAEATLLVSGGERLEPPLFCTVSNTSLGNNQVVETLPDKNDAATLVSCGKSLLNQKILIVHPETCVTCPSDHVGEIWIAGPSIAQGYWGHPEETVQTFQAFLKNTGEGPFLRTGDVGFLQKGELFVVGRIKDMLIMQGQNHYPQDIEHTASLSHPALKT